MRIAAVLLITMVCAACSSTAMTGMSAEQRAARNQCEATRSYQPYRPNDCAAVTGRTQAPGELR